MTRDQLARNTEAAWLYANQLGKDFCLIVCHEHALKHHEELLITGYRDGTWAGGWPHLTSSERQLLGSRNDEKQTGRACLRGSYGHRPPPLVRERRPNGFHLANVTSTITESTTAERASHFSPEHTVGSKDKRLWHRQPERPGGLEIDDELKAGRLLDG